MMKELRRREAADRAPRMSIVYRAVDQLELDPAKRAPSQQEADPADRREYQDLRL